MQFTSAQNAQQQVEKQYVHYSQLMIDKNYAAALEYMNPEFFKAFPKTQMLAILQETMNDSTMEIVPELPIFTSFDDLKVIDNKRYVRFVIKAPLKMKLMGIEKSESEESNYLAHGLQMSLFESMFGEGNVLYDEVTGYYKTISSKNVIASSDENSADWKFVIIESDNIKPILANFIPAELLY
jgi:hypothetical protein